MSRENRWESRPIAAAMTRALVFLIPLVLGAGVGLTVASLLPAPAGPLQNFAWWVLVISTATLTATFVDRHSRRLLPLGWLLEMTMLFPDQAPSRVRVARRTGNIAELRRRIAEAEAGGDATRGESAELILSLATALSRHDPKTRGHAERTRIYTDLLAEEMQLPDADRDRLRWAALLHDIGKLEVPTEILNKREGLTADEWAQIQNHPITGMHLIEPLADWLGPWAQTIEHHHEQWDGSGYPYGLSGTDIAFGARIVSVADAYDVMTSGRAYQAAKSPDAARREIATMARQQFDPVVVRALMMLSIGRLRLAAGPFAALAQLPLVRNGRNLGRDALTVASSAALMFLLVTTGVLGIGRDLDAGGGVPAVGDVVAAPAADDSSGGEAPSASDPVGSEVLAEPSAGSTTTGPTTSIAAAPPTTVTAEPTPTTTTPPTTAPPTTTPPTTPTTTTPSPDPTDPPGQPDDDPDSSTTTTTAPPSVTVTANADIATTDEVTTIAIDVTANDTAGSERVVVDTLTIIQPAALGQATVVDDMISYAPGAPGRDTFRYEVCGTVGGCDSAVVSVTVLASPNASPTAGDTSLTTTWVQPASVSLPVSDPDGDPLTVTVTTAPAAGAASVSGASLTYQPQLGVAGAFTVGYTACDPDAACASGTVAVTVSGIAVAVDDRASMPVNTTGNEDRTIDVLANDYTSAGPAAGASVTITIVGQPANGQILGLGGGIRYSPDRDFQGTDSFRYQLCDGTGSCDVATVTVTVG